MYMHIHKVYNMTLGWEISMSVHQQIFTAVAVQGETESCFIFTAD